MYASVRGYVRDITVIRTYEPPTDHSEDQTEAFYEAEENVMDETPKDIIKFLVGIWNAKRTWASAN
jgi:hypothetical protein